LAEGPLWDSGSKGFLARELGQDELPVHVPLLKGLSKFRSSF